MYEIKEFLNNYLIYIPSERCIALCTRHDDATKIQDALNNNNK